MTQTASVTPQPTLRSNADQLREEGHWAEALPLYQQLLDQQPQDADLMVLLGNAHLMVGQHAVAVARYTDAINAGHGNADVWVNRGTAHYHLRDLDAAAADYRQAVALQPTMAQAHRNLAGVLYDAFDFAAAAASLSTAMDLDPALRQHLPNHWLLAQAVLPAVRSPKDDLDSLRQAYAQRLDRLAVEVSAADVASDNGPLLRWPFHLAYQIRNNRELMARHGALAHALMARWQQTHVRRPPPRAHASGRIRLGIVSHHVHRHSVWQALVHGWIAHLDRTRFEIHLFHTGQVHDAQTAWAKSQVAHYTHGLPTLSDWAQAVASAQVDVLLYPEVGMDATSFHLASMRLAPLQCASWGHPETTGLPTIDHYLSADGLEPAMATAQTHYTEHLVTLPNLGCACMRNADPIEPFDAAAHGLRTDLPILVCPGMFFKYAPEHDAVWARIAKALGPCQLVFFSHNAPSTRLFKARLSAAFDAQGVDADAHMHFLPWLNEAQFRGLLQQATVFLDSMGFSGFNTVMHAVECDLPVVTQEGAFMRGRLGSAILQRMDLHDLVTHDDEAYMAKAVQLVQQTHYRQDVVARMQRKRDVLYDDVAPIRALEDWLVDATRTTRTHAP